MDQKVKEYVIEKAKDLLQAPSCCPEAKEAAQNWLDAIGTDKETEQAKKMIAELEMDIMPIEQLIAFAESEAGIQLFGAEKAKGISDHAHEIQASGAKYCDCPACVSVAAILEKRDELF